MNKREKIDKLISLAEKYDFNIIWQDKNVYVQYASHLMWYTLKVDEKFDIDEFIKLLKSN